MLEAPPEGEEAAPTEIPDDIFSPVIGYEDIKEFLAVAIKREKRLHFLFEGSPSTAKSLFMFCIQRAIPQAYYATGSRTTAPGLTDALVSNEPTVLLLDEVEKCDMQSYAVLLSLMESGMWWRRSTGGTPLPGWTPLSWAPATRHSTCPGVTLPL